jgi:hypothetical protein
MIILHIPLQAPSQNDFSKYRDYHMRSIKTKEIRGAWAAACRVAMRAAGVPAAIGPRRLHVIAYRRQRCRDEANLIGGMKPAVDGLVDAGLLIDDAKKYARISYQQKTVSESPTRRAHTVLNVENIDSQPTQITTQETP